MRLLIGEHVTTRWKKIANGVSMHSCPGISLVGLKVQLLIVPACTVAQAEDGACMILRDMVCI